MEELGAAMGYSESVVKEAARWRSPLWASPCKRRESVVEREQNYRGFSENRKGNRAFAYLFHGAYTHLLGKVDGGEVIATMAMLHDDSMSKNNSGHGGHGYL